MIVWIPERTIWENKMPRRKVDLKNLPTEAQALQEYIEQMAASSVDTIIRDVRQLPWKRHAH